VLQQRLKRRARAGISTHPGDLVTVAHKMWLEDTVKIEIVDEGLRIQFVETTQGIFLGLVGRTVGKLPTDVVLEGHTDSRP